MSRSSAPMRVSARDREIFHKVTVEGRGQRAVGGEYGLSQPRVAAIVKRMKKWSEQPLPLGLGEACRSERLAGLARVHRMRLSLYHQLAMEAFRKSETVHTVKVFMDAEGKTLRQERTGKSAGGNVRFLDFAEKFEERLLEFEGVAKDGSVDLKAEDRLPDVPGLSDDEMMETIEAYVNRMLPVCRAWRAKKEGESGRGGDKVTGGSDQASVEASARRGEEVGSSECGVGSENVTQRPRACPGGLTAFAPVTLASGPIELASSAQASEPTPQGRGRLAAEIEANVLSKTLSREEAGNSAVEMTAAGVIGPVMAVINAARKAVGWTSGPTGMEERKKDGLEVHPTGAMQADGLEVHPTEGKRPDGLEAYPTEAVGPEVQPAEPERDIFFQMRHMLPRLTVYKREQRITYENRIKVPLREEVEREWRGERR